MSLLVSDKFIEKSRTKWPQDRIDKLSITVFQDDKRILTATPKTRRNTVKQVVKLKRGKNGKSSNKY